MNLRKYLFTSSVITIIAVLFVLFMAAGCSVLLQKQVNLSKQNQSKTEQIPNEQFKQFLVERDISVKDSDELQVTILPPRDNYRVYKLNLNLLSTPLLQDYLVLVKNNKLYLMPRDFHRLLYDSGEAISETNAIQMAERFIKLSAIDVPQIEKSELRNVTIADTPYEVQLETWKKLNGVRQQFNFHFQYGQFYSVRSQVLAVFEGDYVSSGSPAEYGGVLIPGKGSVQYYTPEIILPWISTDNVDTSIWQTYRNEQYGFEVKYPENFYITSVSERLGDIYQEFVVDLAKYKIPPPIEYDGVRIAIGTFSGDFEKYIDERIKQGLETGNDIYGSNVSINDVVKSEIVINNSIGYKVDGMHGSGGGPNIYFAKKGKIFSIGNSLGDDKLFNQILSTFKFISLVTSTDLNITACMSEWKKQFVNFDVTTSDGFVRAYESGKINFYFKDGTTEAAARAWLDSKSLSYSPIYILKGFAYSVTVRVSQGRELELICKFQKAPLVKFAAPIPKPAPLPTK
ncbi:MAG: hypothetical protein V1712_00755 [Patescibacteria group bacterium]